MFPLDALFIVVKRFTLLVAIRFHMQAVWSLFEMCFLTPNDYCLSLSLPSFAFLSRSVSLSLALLTCLLSRFLSPFSLLSPLSVALRGKNPSK